MKSFIKDLPHQLQMKFSKTDFFNVLFNIKKTTGEEQEKYYEILRKMLSECEIEFSEPDNSDMRYDFYEKVICRNVAIKIPFYEDFEALFAFHLLIYAMSDEYKKIEQSLNERRNYDATVVNELYAELITNSKSRRYDDCAECLDISWFDRDSGGRLAMIVERVYPRVKFVQAAEPAGNFIKRILPAKIDYLYRINFEHYDAHSLDRNAILWLAAIAYVKQNKKTYPEANRRIVFWEAFQLLQEYANPFLKKAGYSEVTPIHCTDIYVAYSIYVEMNFLRSSEPVFEDDDPEDRLSTADGVDEMLRNYGWDWGKYWDDLYSNRQKANAEWLKRYREPLLLEE